MTTLPRFKRTTLSFGTHRLGFVVGLFILTPWAGYEIVDEGWPQFNWEVITGIVFLAVFSTVIATFGLQKVSEPLEQPNQPSMSTSFHRSESSGCHPHR